MTFAQHMALAAAWSGHLGQRGTDTQALRVMRNIDGPTLQRRLVERGVPMPLGCEQVVEPSPAVDAWLVGQRLAFEAIADWCGPLALGERRQ